MHNEVAAGYMSWRVCEGAAGDQTQKASPSALDGFYIFVVETESGFGVLRGRSRASPPSWPRPTSGSRSAPNIAHWRDLPGIDTASIWEPAPAELCMWERHRCALS